jgi:FKBP12-rapamycin complex-associated protein
MHLAANAAMNLGQWDKLEKYVAKITDHADKDFWLASINIHKNCFDEARNLIQKQLRDL